ncbi:MAG: hypothetical protein Q8M40_03035 [Legionella sp.]|nr:hypothetical protein [Legionella sp.]
MPQNIALANALKDTQGLSALGLNACIAALDEVLRVQPDDAVAFRKAVVKHQNFWNRYNEQLVKAPPKPTGLMAQATGLLAQASGWALRTAGISINRDENSLPESDYFTSSSFLNPDDEVSFVALQQLAAEQLAILSVYRASNPMLVSLMGNHNRDYVSEQLELLVGEEHADRILVTDETIKSIRSLATRLYLRNINDTLNDEHSINDLINAKTPQEFDAALEELLQIPFGTITELYPEDRILLKNRLEILRASAARNAILTQVLAIGDDTSLNNVKNAVNQQELDRAVRVLIPDYQNGSLTLLTAEEKDLVTIQQKKTIRFALLKRIVDLAKSQESLDTLTNARDQGALNRSAKALLPSYVDDALTYPLPAEEQNIISLRRIKLRNEAEKVSITTYIKDAPDADILNMKNWLESPDLEFANRLRQQFPHVHNNDVDWARGKLGFRYLKSVIPTLNEDLLPVIHAENTEVVTNKLKEILGNHDYISLAVTEENVPDLKRRLIINHLNQWMSADNAQPTINVLYELINAPKSADFKQALIKVGVRADWLDKVNINLIKQDIRARIFSMAIGFTSKWGVEFYSEINKIFRDLPLEKQNILLKGVESGDAPNIRHLIHAMDAHAVAYYLGDSPAVRAVTPAIIANNKKMSLFAQIHNAGVSRALASIKADLNLDGIQIHAINNLLRNIHNLPNNPPNIPAEYNSLLDNIKALLPQGLDNVVFKNAFGVNDAGGFTDRTIYNEIKTQSEYNIYLLNNPTIKKHPQLQKLLLNLYKHHLLDEPKFNNILSSLTKRNTLTQFLNDLPNNTNEEKLLKAQLTKELSAVLFNDLKNEQRAINLKNNNAEQDVIAVLNGMEKELKGIQLNNKVLVQNSKSLKFITTINSTELFNPEFIDKASFNNDEIKAKYQNLSKECDLTIDKLNTNINALDGLLKSLPRDEPNASRPQVVRLRSNLEKELAHAKQSLIFYREVQNKLSGDQGILKAIDNLIINQRNYVYKARGVTCAIKPVEKAHEGIPAGGAPVVAQQGDIVLENTKPGQVYVYDVTHRTANFEAVGRFTQSYNDIENTQSMNVKDDVWYNPMPCKVQVIQPPKQTIPVLADGTAPDPQIQQAKVKFYMDMAVAIVNANGGKVPTKKRPVRLNGSNAEEVKYLWTALVILGEGKPRFGEDAIVVESSAFVPKEEKGFSGQFTNASAYKVFKKPENIDVIKEAQKKVTEYSGKVTEHNENRAKANDVASKYKKLVHNKKVLEGQEEKIDKEGPAPAAP